ncbi:MAG TPA: pitrilysin family protein [Flavipsychrobacter sp.]|nr:pitrilysin family protein [Flavipsychrobacter sp.]
MKRILLSISAIAVLCNPVNIWAQAKLVEKISPKGSEVVIPYEKYVLPNGLTIIVHEDHSDPIVHVDVTYHVGSAREEIGKSGFAHFFEHMMFQGSDNVADEQHFKIITEAGGTLNGTTNLDRTNYFETVPSNQLEKMLWLEADRMGFLLDAVTQQKFEVQRATVKNERVQRYDNVPYGLVREVTAKNLYPYGHPYSWLTIGYIEDLNRVNVEDLKNFFLRWYGPNNAVLTVGGDVNAKDVVKMAEKYFGSIPRGPKVEPVKLPLPTLEKNRFISMMDNYAKLPQLRITYPTSPSYSKDEAALDCLAEIVGQGKNSIFYKNFVKTQKAVNAMIFNGTNELSGEFTITVIPYPGQKLADIEKMVKESFDEFEKRGVTSDDIEKFKSQREAQIINGLESVSGKVSQLAAFHTFTGNANYIGKEIARYNAVTKEDVMRVYQQYIKGKPAVVLSVLTKGNETNKVAEDNYTVSTGGYKAPDYGYNGLKYVKAKDNFDRSKVPGNGANPVVEVPAYWQETIAGSVKAIGTKSDEIPVVTIQLKFKGGKMMDVYYPSKVGTANLFTSMMDEDTKNFSAEDFSIALEKLGSSIDVYTDDDATVVNVRSLKKNLDKTLQLLEERLLRPKFTTEAFETNKKRSVESIKNAMNRPNYVASTIYPKILYGSDNVLGWSSTGTVQTISNIQLADVEHYYNNYFSKKDAQVIVVGDVSKEQILPKLSFLQQLSDKEIKLPELKQAPQVAKTKIYFVNVPNAAQTEFRVGYVTGLKYDALGDYYKAGVMNYSLGGAFNSRLNLHLREEKGWTYGARGSFDGNKYTGDYSFSAGIRADATDSALADVMRIITDFRNKGVSSEELEFTRKSMGQSDARKYEAAFQKAGFLSRILDYNLPSTYTKDQNALLEQLKLDEVNKLASRYTPDPAKVNIVLVGDKAKVWDNLKKLGYDMEELDRDGNTVKTQ